MRLGNVLCTIGISVMILGAMAIDSSGIGGWIASTAVLIGAAISFIGYKMEGGKDAHQ